MAFTNFETKEINCKIVYFGAEDSGKASNLRSLYETTSREIKSGLIELDKRKSENKTFSFLPISLGHVRDFHLKAHLFILPSSSLYETVPSVILKGIDGFVFVCNSEIKAMSKNVESFNITKKTLSEQGYNPIDMPKVIQYNKRDLKDIVPIELLKKEFNYSNFPEQEAIANQSIGTIETLESIAKQVIKKLST